MKKKKIAILGGGMGAISAAFWLTHPGNPERENIEVTVYQLGWRLGGKCASGRNTERNNRIEERGMHALFGYYYNTLRMLRECLRELERGETAGHRQFHRNFEPLNQAVVGDLFGGRWRAIRMPFPPRRKNERELDAGEYVKLLCRWIAQVLQVTPLIRRVVPARSQRAAQAVDLLAVFCDELALKLGMAHSKRRPAGPEDARCAAIPEPQPTWLASLLQNPSVLGFLEATGGFVFRRRSGSVGSLLERLREGTWHALYGPMQRNADTRAAWLALDLAFTTVRGMVTDDVLTKGYDSLDDITFCQWLRKHGAHDDTVVSPFVRSLGGSGFAYPGGDTSAAVGAGGMPEADSAAGMVLRNTLRMLFGYRGAFMWKMRTGMGDAIFAPLYEVLKQRGVKFEFFHRVRRLEPDAGGKIARIHIGRQVTLRSGTYDPLIDVKTRKCWPHRPLYDQMIDADAAALRELQSRPQYRDVPLLESCWGPWDRSHETPVVLECGRDFDDVVLGISLGALPAICGELGERWKQLFEHVRTVRTQAFQLWMNEGVDELAAESDVSLRKVVATAYAPPIDSWSDFVQTAPSEEWPPGQEPATIGYFCGVMGDDPDEPPPWRNSDDPDEARPVSDPDYPAAQYEKAYWMMERVVSQQVRDYWPKAFDGNGFRYDLLMTAAGSHATGRERLKEQYWTANFEPHDRYVLSVAGSLRYRLRPEAGREPGQSGFDNLHLAGDWTRTGLNAGFVESAVVSGMQAARSLTSWPQFIEAENDLQPKKK